MNKYNMINMYLFLVCSIFCQNYLGIILANGGNNHYSKQRKLGLLELQFPKSWLDIMFSELNKLFFSVYLYSIEYGYVKKKLNFKLF